MVNSAEFIGRLEKILGHYGLSAAAFADSIGVQRSSISHLLSGRNKPSLDFVLRVVKEYPEVNLYWLLNGKGKFPAVISSNPSPVTSQVLPKSEPTEKQIKKILVLYEDGSFEAYDSIKSI